MAPGRKFFMLASVMGVMGFVPAHAETIRVVVDNLTFKPAAITVRVGDTIEWVNNDIIAHTATVKGDWDVLIPAKKSASLVVKAAGSVEYYCRFHPNMTGTITAAPR